jgi:hypothetical protein
MRTKLLIASAGIAALAAPALAAEYYIVQDPGTKRCSIVEQRPAEASLIVVNDKVYGSRTEAEGEMTTVKVCETGTTVGGPTDSPSRPQPR